MKKSGINLAGVIIAYIVLGFSIISAILGLAGFGLLNFFHLTGIIGIVISVIKLLWLSFVLYLVIRFHTGKSKGLLVGILLIIGGVLTLDFITTPLLILAGIFVLIKN